MNDILMIILILVIPMIAQIYVTSSYSKYKKIELDKKIIGFEVARKILDSNGLENVHVVQTQGMLADHYDPKRKVIRLSKEVFDGETVAAASIAAHEVGHAIQDKNGYFFLRLRSIIFPVVRVATMFSYIIIFIGLLAEGFSQFFYIGIALVAIGLFFQFITLPVEFNASKKAKAELKKLDLTTEAEQIGTNQMLNAAAMTYVAGVLSSALELLRLVMIFRSRD